MPSVSGRVVFDVDRSNSINTGDTGLSNIPVVLRDSSTGQRLTVLTDINGDYTFNNVPNGNYIIVEAYGELGGITTPGNFLTSTFGPVPTGNDPPITSASNPPIGATDIDSLTPNTISVTLAGIDLVNQNFLDGPIIYTPITSILDPCTTIQGINLITAASNGTFGSNPAGTAADTAPVLEPYPGISPGFTYTTSSTPIVGSYTIKNILNNGLNEWWNTTNHTVGDETGRFMVVNGGNPGGIIFTNTVTVNQNTNYLLSTWILNLINQAVGYANPVLGVEILDQSGNVLYQQTLGNSIPVNVNVPQWMEIGTLLNSGSNTQLTVRFISEGPGTSGNDFAIDDVKLRPITVPNFTQIKSVSNNYADIGDVVTYTIVLQNTCSTSLINVNFQDTIPTGITFVSQSVTVNGTPDNTLNPNTGFSLPDITGGGSTTITFQGTVDNIPTLNPTSNISRMTYDYNPVFGGIPIPYTNNSNSSPVRINNATLTILKEADKTVAKPGETINYTITITNLGNVEANPALFTDTIPTGTTFVANSLIIDGVSSSLNPSSGVSVAPIAAGEVKIVTFSVVVNDNAQINPISNSANIVYEYIVDPNSTRIQNTANSNVVNIGLLNLQITKTASESEIKVGDLLTYTFVAVNNSSLQLDNVVFQDSIPSGTSYIAETFSVNGTLVPGADPVLGVSLGNMAIGESIEVEFNVQLDFIPCPSSLVNFANINYEYTDPITLVVENGSDISNIVTTEIQTSSFKQLYIDETLSIPTIKPDIERVLDIQVNINISNIKLVNTSIGTSNEGQILTGNKLIINGYIDQVIEYVALLPEQPVHSAHFNNSFCTFIIMESNFTNLCQIEIDSYIEDIFFKQIDERRVFSNITFRLETGV